jgi:hypothetical protein
MNEELLQALEGAYAKGYDINWAKQFATNNGAGDLIPEIEEFYKKKKGLGSVPGPSTSEELPSESPSPASVSPVLFDTEAWKRVGPSLGFVKGSVIPEAEEEYSSWLIADENPNEIQRLWNRAVSRGRLGSLVAGFEANGTINPEEVAYYNSILQRDAPKDEDWLSANVDEHPVGSFILDVVRTLPESMLAAGAAFETGAVGAAGGAGVGAGLLVLEQFLVLLVDSLEELHLQQNMRER